MFYLSLGPYVIYFFEVLICILKNVYTLNLFTAVYTQQTSNLFSLSTHNDFIRVNLWDLHQPRQTSLGGLSAS